MKRFLLLTLCLLVQAALFAQLPKYSRARIHTGADGLKRLSEAGVCVDHGEVKKGEWFVSDFSDRELQKVTQLGLSYDVLIDDVSTYYVNRNAERNSNPSTQPLSGNCSSSPNVYPVPSEFNYGSMGGFFTYTELMDNLDSMAARYPNLVKPRIAIDSTMTTYEGRYLYWVKISDNPTVDENEPEMLFSALHHAREPCGASSLIYFMYYLLEHYGSDPEIQYLVDHTELYFVVCVNPDGYLYNESTNPNGGGMWRKNRRDNLDGEFGIDLNRNYGYNWGFDNNGSSPNTIDDTYRGTAAFSEPETQQMRDFCIAHNFRIAINYHTYSNVLVMPWGYDDIQTPDSSLFNAYGKILTSENGYAYGTAMQTVGYNANGDSDDWMYGDQVSKPKIISVTPEAGDPMDGFWPQQNRIIPLCQDNMGANMNAVRLLLAYAQTTETDLRYLTQTSGQIHFEVKRLGLDSPAVYTVTVHPNSSWISSVGGPRTYSTLALLQTVNDSIAYTLNSSTPQGATIQYVIETSNGAYSTYDTITKIYGQPVTVMSTNGNSITGWIPFAGWNISTSTYYSPTASLTDSPSGNYASNVNSRITTSTPISLGTGISANLRFHAKWALERGFDYAQVQISDDGGANWYPLCSRYTTTKPTLDAGNPIYTGSEYNWVEEEMSLDNYVGSNILLRFRLSSDWGVNLDGYYFDDLIVEKIDTSTTAIAENGNLPAAGEARPNPATGETFIPLMQIDRDLTLDVYDAQGTLVLRENIAKGSRSVRLATDKLSQGVYSYRLVGDGVATGARRLIVIH